MTDQTLEGERGRGGEGEQAGAQPGVSNAPQQDAASSGAQSGAASSAPTAPALVDLPIPRDAELYAGVDVGTNSVKMIIADLAQGRANRIFEQTIITRLGEGAQLRGGRLSEIAMERSLDALAILADAARAHNVRATAAVGTAALRDALNRDDFLKRVYNRCGLSIEVIPGEEEARLSYLAVRRDPQWRDLPGLRVIDIGGGSTEIIEGVPNTDQVAARISVNYGAVKLTETFLKSDPPTVAELEQANRAVMDAFARIDQEAVRNADTGSQTVFHWDAPYTLVGVGGTVTNLGAMNQGGRGTAEPLHGHVLTAERLGDHIDLLGESAIEQRKLIPGLDSRRADIILGGAILLAQALARLNAPSLLISTRGLRWGLLYDRFTKL